MLEDRLMLVLVAIHWALHGQVGIGYRKPRELKINFHPDSPITTSKVVTPSPSYKPSSTPSTNTIHHTCESGVVA